MRFPSRLGRAIAMVLGVCALGVSTVTPAAIGSAGSDSATDGPLRIEDGHFVDDGGRVRLLHGVNVVYKRPPYIATDAEFGEADADAIAALGFNTVRLGFIWAGMQPERGLVDASYLERYADLVDMLAARGIYVLIDSHQDLYNERYDGEGAPAWAVFDDGPPFLRGLAWMFNYFFQPAVWKAYQDFWDNRDGIQDEYISMWTQLADRFEDHPMVLGYDLINEPWSGSKWYRHGWDSQTLAPFYSKAIAAIREVDGGRTIFWETPLSNQLGTENTIDQSDLGAATNTALSYHVYCAFTLFRIFVPHRPYVEPLCDWFSRPKFVENDHDRRRTESGWLLSEFGATDVVPDVALHLRLADDFMSSWQYWAWKQYDDPTGDPDESLVLSDTGPIEYKPKIHVLERSYARAIAGEPETMSFDPESGRFRLSFRPDPDVDGPTVVWVPHERHYPHGYVVRVDGGSSATSSTDDSLVYIEADADADLVTVEIEAE